MARIEYKNDQTRALEEAEGSDGRLNVSSRGDSRGYYISRDQGQSYTAAFDFQSATAGEYAFYLKNTSTTNQDLVVSIIRLSSVENARAKLWFVTGTAAAGTTLTPTNTNKISSNAATAEAMEGGSAANGITGLSTAGLIDFEYISANDGAAMPVDDRIRLGQNDAIAIEYDEGTTGDFSGVCYFFFEPNQ